MHRRSVFIVLAFLFLAVRPLGAQSVSEFEQTMRQLGLSTSDRDASAEAAITIEEPRLAYVNLSDLGSLPTSKWTEEECWLEFHGAGTYFRKRITIKGQGGYSIRYPKKNFSFSLPRACSSSMFSTQRFIMEQPSGVMMQSAKL